MATKITITIEAQKEDETPEHSEKATGSAPGYAKAVRETMKKAEGLWGWCIVKVTVKDKGATYLGNCSYENAEDFIAHSGYFEQMVNETIEDAEEDSPLRLRPRRARLNR